MQMTPRFMVHASRLPYLHSPRRSLNASKQLRRGCVPIGFSLIQIKLKCCGAPDDSISCPVPTTPLLIDGCSVTPVSTVRDLGIYIDSYLSMRSQVKHTVSRCFASLRGLRQIRRCVPPATLRMMVVALVHSRLDYGNGVLVGLPAYLMRQLQSVLNAVA